MRENNIITVAETHNPYLTLSNRTSIPWTTCGDVGEMRGKGRVSISRFNGHHPSEHLFGDIQRAVGTYKSIPEMG